MQKTGKLELTWVGKYDEKKIEPRILVEDTSKSYGDPLSENMLIHGDNLIALQALQQDFTGKIKCIYIDPPYNTGSAFEHYDDNLEHSIWLGLMRQRLILLRQLLADEGSIWIQIDDEEQAYLKILCDEVFGRKNFINIISVNMKNTAGASGGGEDKRLKKNCEFILVYAKDYQELSPFKNAYDYTEMYQVVLQYREQKKNWHYTSVLVDPGNKIYVGSTTDGNGDEIKIYKRENPIVKSIKSIMGDENISEKEVYYRYGQLIFEAKDAQSSIRKRVIEAKRQYKIDDDIVSIEYVPKTGKNKGTLYEQFYKGDSCRLFAWLKDISEVIDGVLYKKDKQGTYWDFTSSVNNLTKEGEVQFSNGKKPEALVSRVFSMATEEGDLVLDSFLGSGTTASVAHKMRRNWICVELGEHAYSLCKPRLDRVIQGKDKGGITKQQNWQGGGGYHFYELAPSLLIRNKQLPIYQINPSYTYDMLCQAVCKIEGFKFKVQDIFHGYSSEKRFIHITKEFINAEYIKSLSSRLSDDQSLLVYGIKIQSDLVLPENIEVKRIPKDLLDKCDFESEVL